MADIDQRTNDFCRDDKLMLENNQDIYIKCSGGIKIFHYGGSTLLVYIPSVNKGMNILKSIYREYINRENTITENREIERKDGKNFVREIVTILDSELFKNELNNLSEKDIIYGVERTDSEALYKIKDKNLNKITNLLKPQKSGAGISPFSSKNLPKCKDEKYQLTNAQIEEYRAITDNVSKEDKLKIGHITSTFLNDILCKKCKINMKTDVKPEMKKLMIKAKEYINYKGFWDEYLEYLKQNLDV